MAAVITGGRGPDCARSRPRPGGRLPPSHMLGKRASILCSMPTGSTVRPGSAGASLRPGEPAPSVCLPGEAGRGARPGRKDPRGLPPGWRRRRCGRGHRGLHGISISSSRAAALHRVFQTGRALLQEWAWAGGRAPGRSCPCALHNPQARALSVLPLLAQHVPDLDVRILSKCDGHVNVPQHLRPQGGGGAGLGGPHGTRSEPDRKERGPTSPPPRPPAYPPPHPPPPHPAPR
jgi:hypothetical protein